MQIAQAKEASVSLIRDQVGIRDHTPSAAADEWPRLEAIVEGHRGSQNRRQRPEKSSRI